MNVPDPMEDAVQVIPYCGLPPEPGALESRWNLDPVLIACLLAISAFSLMRAAPSRRKLLAGGWVTTALALMSPLCALSVSLFSARVFQHLVLAFVAAPLLATGLPEEARSRPAFGAVLFSIALWFWHMPVPYDATFKSDWTYWAMHLTLFGSALLMWHGLLRHRRDQALRAISGGLGASMAMGFLGAVLTLSSRALFSPHYLTAEAWGFGPLEDQQLGGVLMWVPALALFLFAAIRSSAVLSRLAQPHRAGA